MLIHPIEPELSVVRVGPTTHRLYGRRRYTQGGIGREDSIRNKALRKSPTRGIAKTLTQSEVLPSRKLLNIED